MPFRWAGWNVRGIARLADVPDGGTVVLPAHGVDRQTSAAAEHAVAERGVRVLDATCPLVARTHATTRRFADDGATVVVIGAAGHVAVPPIVGQAVDTVLVTSAGEVDELAVEDPVPSPAAVGIPPSTLPRIGRCRALTDDRLLAVYDQYEKGVRTLVPAVTEDAVTAVLGNCVAARVSKRFDLHGPNTVVDDGVDSTLTALRLAMRAPRNGDLPVLARLSARAYDDHEPAAVVGTGSAHGRSYLAADSALAILTAVTHPDGDVVVTGHGGELGSAVPHSVRVQGP